MVPEALLGEWQDRFVGRIEMRAAAEALVPKIRAELFDKQLEVVDETSRLVSGRCPRRAGKTTLIPRAHVLDSIQKGELTQAWAISHTRAKELAWDEFGRLNQRHNIGARFNDSALTIRWPWGERAITRLKGADKAKETHKKRGDRLGMASVDESQLMDSAGATFLKELVEEVLEPATQDVQGRIFLFGTPGVVPKGYWHDASPNDVAKTLRGWKQHYWHTRDNRAMPNIWLNFLEMKARRGWTDDNPTWQREYLGLWVDDPEALFYAFSEARNVYDVLPRVGGWSYALGWDLGSGGENDPSALHVWGFTPELPDLYEIASWKKQDAGLEEVMEEAARLESELGGFVSEVADTGGSGKVAVDYVNRRYHRKFKAAAKTEKFTHAQMFNDDLRRGRVKGKRGSSWSTEVAALPKDPEEPTKEHPDYGNHCSDAALYAWREAKHFWHEPPPKPVSDTERVKREEQRILEAVLDADARASFDDGEWQEWG